MKIFPQFLGSNINIVKKRFFQKVRHLVVIYTPKEAHSRIFVIGGQYSRDKGWQTKTFSWRGELVLRGQGGGLGLWATT